jgi:hypothetical protein
LAYVYFTNEHLYSNEEPVENIPLFELPLVIVRSWWGACVYCLFSLDVLSDAGDQLHVAPLQELIEWHRPQVRALTEAGVDMLAFETIPAQKEAEALVQLLREFPSSKAWISFSCKVRFIAESFLAAVYFVG